MTDYLTTSDKSADLESPGTSSIVETLDALWGPETPAPSGRVDPAFCWGGWLRAKRYHVGWKAKRTLRSSWLSLQRAYLPEIAMCVGVVSLILVVVWSWWIPWRLASVPPQPGQQQERAHILKHSTLYTRPNSRCTLLRQLREQRGLSLAQVQVQSQVYANYLARVERGELPMTNPYVLAQLARVYGVNVDQLQRATTGCVAKPAGG